MSETREIIIIQCPHCQNGSHNHYPVASPVPATAITKHEEPSSGRTVVRALIIGGIIGLIIGAALSDSSSR